jgi:NlpC/P60 family putative phage cell wall peptidase
MTIREDIVTEAKSWIGTPYHHQANVKGHGVDCVWMPLMVYKAIGLIPADFSPAPYSRDWFLHKTTEIYMHQVQNFARRIENPEIGDFALFKQGHCYSHGAILAEPDLIIHAHRQNRKVEYACISQSVRNRPVTYWTLL